MARRKSGIVEVLLEMTAALPCWTGVSFAVIAYAVLHHYASIEMPTSAAVPGQIGHIFVEQMGGTLAYYGQYILPLLFLVGALASILKRHKRKGLVKTASNAKSSNALHDIT